MRRPVPEMARVDWSDPFLIDRQLSDEERDIRERVRNYAQTHLLPRVVEYSAREKIDTAVFRELGALGVLGLTLPEQYTCAGASHVSYGLVARELETIDSSYRSMAAVQSSLVMYPIFAYGDEVQRRRYLPRLAAGEWIGCYGLSEPRTGADAASILTVAEPIAGGYRLRGTKTWILHAPIADIFVIWARSSAHDGQIRGFILERGMQGLATPRIDGKLGMRAAVTGEIVLDDVEVPQGALLSGVSGLEGPLGCLNLARYAASWGCMGAAEDCWHRSRDYALDREQFGRLLAATQLVQRKLADMQTEIAIGLQASLRVGRLLDQGGCSPEAIALVRRNNCCKALMIARMARDIHGANGIHDEYHVMRHVLNLEAVDADEGSSDVLALVLGHSQTGIRAFS